MLKHRARMASWSVIVSVAVVQVGCQPDPVDERPPEVVQSRPAALTAPSDGIRIDFGNNPLNRLDRHTPWEGTEAMSFTADLGGFSATIKRGDGTTGVQFFDRGDSNLPGEVGNMVEDGVLNGSGLRLTFTGLKPAVYHFKSYHHDVTIVQGTLDIFVSDADTSNRQVANELAVTSGSEGRVVASTTFSFRSNGTSPVVIDFKDGANNKTVLINGFALTRSPYHAAARADMGATGQNLEGKHTLWSSTETRDFLQMDGFTGTIKRANGTSGVEWFDRGDVSGTLGNLVEDGVKSPFGLMLTLKGLEAGRFQIKTYHHDATVTQGTIDIFVDDLGRTNAQVANEVRVSKGTASPTITSATFEFTADGTNDVRIYLRQGAVVGQPLINGFELNKRYRDLVVSHIERTPRYFRYDLEYGPENTPTNPGVPTLCANNAGKKRWPAVGETVTYTAHVINAGITATSQVQYRWNLPGGGTVTGSIPALQPGAKITVPLSRAFPASPESIEFVADSANQVVENDDTNNSLRIGSHDLTLSIWVEQAQYDLFKNSATTIGSPSFEDWLRRQIAWMNQDFADSTYPFAPAGAVDRVRVDKLVVANDIDILGQHGIACTGEANDPDKMLIDGRWSFRDGETDNSVGHSWGYQWYIDFTDFLPARVDSNLVHELGHQLGLIDEYRMNLSGPLCNNNGLHVLDAGGQQINVISTPIYHAFEWVFSHAGLMGGGDIRPHNHPDFFSDGSIAAMNSNARKRRGYFGEYLFDTPSQVYLRVMDENGVAITGAQVQLFQKEDNSIDNVAEHSKTSDSQGRVLLTNRTATPIDTDTGHHLRNNPFGRIHHEGHNGTMFVRATKGSVVKYGWLLLPDLNIAYQSGHTGTVQCTLKMQAPRPVPQYDCNQPGNVPFVPPAPPREQPACLPFTP
jgi:uncharacterized repeat protein (TIGR01451 family)